MNRCRWPSERAATEHIVKFTAVSFAHGVRKIFFHAGTCGAINGPDEGGVLFEYGGTPRKMYAGVAALSRLLGVPEGFVQSVNSSALHAYLFRCQSRFVGVAWCAAGRTRKIAEGEAVQVYDVMGNRMGAGEIGESPVYVVGNTGKDVLNMLNAAD